MLPKLFSKKFLGIDIGTSAIRMVELGKSGHEISLVNYGQICTGWSESESPAAGKKGVTFFSAQDLADMILGLLSQTKIKTRQCAFSIPDYSTFFTNFFLPPMTKQELAAAVMFEARQHVPLPIENVTIDWQMVGGNFSGGEKIEVTLAAIPNEIIAQYREIAAKAKLDVILMEAEAFGLLQALVSEAETGSLCLIDIGAQSTVCSLVEKRILKTSHSFDKGAIYMTDALAGRLPLTPQEIRSFKESCGLELITFADADIRTKVKDMLKEALTPFFKEIDLMFNNYYRQGNPEVSKIILSGATATLPEIKEQFAAYFKKTVEIADPFTNLKKPTAIEKKLKSMGPVYAVAVGMAQRGLAIIK